MSDTATEAERSRDDDRASYKDTHGLSPIRSVCMLIPYMLSPENAVTLGTQVRAKTQASGPLNPLKKGAGQYRRPVIQAARTRRQGGQFRGLRAHQLPPAEDALLPEAARPDRRAPSQRIGRLIDVVRHPDAPILPAQPLGFRLLTGQAAATTAPPNYALFMLQPSTLSLCDAAINRPAE